MTKTSPRRWFALVSLLLPLPFPLGACAAQPSEEQPSEEQSSEEQQSEEQLSGEQLSGEQRPGEQRSEAAEPAPVALETEAGMPPAPVARESFPRESSFPQESAAQTPAKPQEEGRAFESAVQAEQARKERQQLLLQEYLTKGKEAYNRLEFAAARSAFASALEIDPGSTEAAEWLRRAQDALGEVGPIRAGELTDRSDLMIVRTAEARQQVEQSILDGDRALAARRFDDAIQHYRTAERILAFYPLLAGERNKQREVAGKIDEALRRKDLARVEDEETRRQEAMVEREARERQAREQLENQVRALYDQANIDFLNERYAQAERSLDLLLEIDPQNQRARDLREIAGQARNERADRDTRKTFQQRWRQAFAELGRMMLPQAETIVHDPVYWAEVAARKPLQFQSGAERRTPEDAAVLATLETTFFEPRFANRPIEEVVGYLRNLTQVNFVVSAKIMEMDEGQRSVSIDLPKRSVRAFLDALALVKGFSWRIEDGLVRIGTPEEMKGQTEVRSYEVADLIQIIPDFTGPEITLQPSGGAQIPPGEDPEPAPAFTGDQIMQLIQNTIAPASWQDAEAKTAIRITPQGTLIVRQSPDVHARIERFMNDLREATGLMVEVQTRFLICEDNFLEDVGLDWRGLGDNGNSGVAPSGGLGTAPPFDDFGASPLPGTAALPGPLGTGNQPGFFTQTGSTPIIGKAEHIFDANLAGTNPLTGSGGLALQWISLGDRESELILRAVEKSERVELVTAPRLLIHNAERSTLAVTNQFAYVSGYGVEIAQAASIADPQISVIQDGAILDVRPVVSADRKFVKLELRPTLATLKLPIEQRVVGVGNGTPVTIQFPNLTIRKVRTTVNIPDGGTLLLGGQSVDELRNESSGVPFLRDIPLVGFFFDRKGQSHSKRRLLILLRVKIVIPREYEPRAPAAPGTILTSPLASGLR
jgi:type II secretory pathway component GspD/PulD (secretin)/tetratricopeptide (TPR) repeat protein